jgi:hypothetical protein
MQIYKISFNGLKCITTFFSFSYDTKSGTLRFFSNLQLYYVGLELQLQNVNYAFSNNNKQQKKNSKSSRPWFDTE